jgi:hypothetical protein
MFKRDCVTVAELEAFGEDIRRIERRLMTEFRYVTHRIICVETALGDLREAINFSQGKIPQGLSPSSTQGVDDNEA